MQCHANSLARMESEWTLKDDNKSLSCNISFEPEDGHENSETFLSLISNCECITKSLN